MNSLIQVECSFQFTFINFTRCCTQIRPNFCLAYHVTISMNLGKLSGPRLSTTINITLTIVFLGN